ASSAFRPSPRRLRRGYGRGPCLLRAIGAVPSPAQRRGAPCSMPQKSNENKSFLRRNRAKLIASLIITVGIVFTLQKGGLTLVPEGGDFANVRWWSVPAYLVTLIVMSYFRAVRWRFLLRSFADVPVRRVLAVSWIGFAAILLMPFRIGEIVRPYML